MDKIYARAEKAVFWLGDGDHDTPIIREMSERLLPRVSKLGDISQMHLMDQFAVNDLIDVASFGAGQANERREGVVRFLGRAWLRRAWVYQEAIVAAEVDRHLGTGWCSRRIISRGWRKTESGAKRSRRAKALGRYEQFGTIASNTILKCRSEPLDFLHILWRAPKISGSIESRRHGILIFGIRRLLLRP
jgi:Heterokaryon incompatibility protein (HET)